MPDYGPQSCDTSVDFSTLSDLCEVMPQPLLMTGVFIQWMRMHFSEESRINLTMMKDYIWTSDIDTTELVVDSVFKFNPAQTEARPGLFIKRNPWQVLRLGIDNRKMPATNWEHWPQYIQGYQGSHTIFCIGGESAEVELLATEVYRELVMSGPRARSTFNLLKFQVTEIGEPAILEEATENFVVPVVVSYAGQDVWQICC